MKQVYKKCADWAEAVALVKSLIDEGISAYMQGLTVWVDDGGYDWGL